MKTIYRVWTGDGSMWDGQDHDTHETAVEAIGDRYGWTNPVAVEHCDGCGWSVYETEEDADADVEGAYAAGIRMID